MKLSFWHYIKGVIHLLQLFLQFGKENYENIKSY